MKSFLFQTSMSRGELDPQTAGRIDLKAYYSGLATATNVLTIPQGGVKKRPGLEFLHKAEGDGRLESFSFNTEQNYALAFSNGKMQVFKDGVLQANINGTGNSYLVTPWTLSEIADFDYIQSADTIIITHEDVAPRSITRTSDTTWIIATIALTNVPQFDFNDGSSPSAVDEVQQITFVSSNTGDRFKLALNGVLTDEIVLNNASTSTTENAITDALQALPNTAGSGISTAFSSGTTYEITYSGASANDWDLITGTPTHVISTSFAVSSTVVSNGTSRAEDTWSSGRGWPRTCTFHEGRLWFGGSKSRPATIWGSNIADFFNFNKGKARDDEGITVTLDTDQVNSVNGIFSNRSLQIFTSGGEFYVPESPVTPSNVAVRPQSNLGAKRIRPVSIDGVTLFVQRTGKAINQFVFINEFQANESRSISVLSPHLIKNPIKMSVSIGTESSDANYVYIVNDDGTVTVFNTLLNEDITAFTAWITGYISSLAVVDDQVYMLVKRTIEDSDQYYVERESNLIFTDSAIREAGLGCNTLTGLDHLEGETVRVVADGAVQADQVVDGGRVIIDRVADTIEAGLDYKPVIKTMPLNVGMPNGPSASSKKRIVRAAVNIYESNGVIVNGARLADRTIGQNQFNAPVPQTELKRIHLHGWSLEADLTITQDVPLPWQILSIGLEIKS